MNGGCVFFSWTGFARFARDFGQHITISPETAQSIFLGHKLNALQMNMIEMCQLGLSWEFPFKGQCKMYQEHWVALPRFSLYSFHI